MTTLSIFKKVALAEGISFVFLVLIAMPLKYWAHMPLYVQYGGWVHGLLFVLYIVFLLMAWQEYKWKFKTVVIFGLASLIPLAPFWVEKRLNEENSNNSL